MRRAVSKVHEAFRGIELLEKVIVFKIMFDIVFKKL